MCLPAPPAGSPGSAPGENPAGNPQQTLPLSEPFAIKTFTGARIPHNADMLAPIESCEVCEEFVTINILPKQWQHIRKVGDNYREGEKLLSKGTRLNANHIGLLASLNQIFIPVFTSPKVGILVSGNELLELGQSPSQAQEIYNGLYKIYIEELEKILKEKEG